MTPLFENWREFLEEDLKNFERETLEAQHELNPELWREERVSPQITEDQLQIELTLKYDYAVLQF